MTRGTATRTTSRTWPNVARSPSAAPSSSAWLDSFRSDVNNFRAALEWSLLTGDIDRAAQEAGALAWFWTLNGMLTEAIEHLERLVEVETVPPSTRARCVWGYALLAASLGRLETARDAGYLAADLGRRAADPIGTAYGLNAAAVARVGARRARPVAAGTRRGDRPADPDRGPVGAGDLQGAPSPHPLRPPRPLRRRGRPGGCRPCATCR